MSTTTPRPTPETDSQCYDCEYRGHMGSVFTAEAGKSHPYGDHVSADFARKLERERDEMREELQQWKMLCAWGGTPEHIDQFIKGQQSRIHQAQDIEETCEQLERERDEAREQLEAMREAIKEAHEALDWATSNMNPPFAWEPFKKANAALTKLQPFLP